MIPVFEKIYHSWKIISSNAYAIGFLVFISMFIFCIVLIKIVSQCRCSQKFRFRCCGFYPNDRIPLTLTWEEVYPKENEPLKSANNELEGRPSKNKEHTVIDISDKGER